MPLVKIQTNQPLDDDTARAIARSATTIVAEALGKPEAVTMAIVRGGVALTFGGSDEPAALCEIEGLGSSDDVMPALVEGLGSLAESELSVPGSRTFIKLNSVPRGFWGQDRKVF